jgi:hypothetical protein
MSPKSTIKTSIPASKVKATKLNNTATMTTSSLSNIPADLSGAVYFWHPEDNNGFMSQWYDSPWTHEGTTYSTAEMWMMVQKAKLFKDEVITSFPSTHTYLYHKYRDNEESADGGVIEYRA